MPTITISTTDEEIDRVAKRLADKLAQLLREILSHNVVQSAPKQLQRSLSVSRLQVNRVEAARLLGCNPMTVDRLAARGLLHPNRATRRPMYAIKELERFVRDCSQTI
jgi:ribosomal protein S20